MNLGGRLRRPKNTFGIDENMKFMKTRDSQSRGYQFLFLLFSILGFLKTIKIFMFCRITFTNKRSNIKSYL